MTGWNTDWTKANSPLTQHLIEKIGGVLVGLIESSPDGLWKGTIHQLMAKCGEQGKAEYGTYFNAMPIVREKYNIKYKSAGRNGNKYYFDDKSFISNQQKLNFIQSNDPLTSMPTIHITISFEFPDQTQQITHSYTINP